jgi:hypothetical protein
VQLLRHDRESAEWNSDLRHSVIYGWEKKQALLRMVRVELLLGDSVRVSVCHQKTSCQQVANFVSILSMKFPSALMVAICLLVFDPQLLWGQISRAARWIIRHQSVRIRQKSSCQNAAISLLNAAV